MFRFRRNKPEVQNSNPKKYSLSECTELELNKDDETKEITRSLRSDYRDTGQNEGVVLNDKRIPFACIVNQLMSRNHAQR